MSSIPKSTPELEAAINAANTHEDLREAILQTLAAQGQIVRSHDNQCDTRLIRQPEPNAPLPTSAYRFEKEIRFHPESGKRTLIIRANTKEDLDALEAQILHY